MRPVGEIGPGTIQFEMPKQGVSLKIMGRYPFDSDEVRWVFHEGHCVWHTGRAAGSEGA